MMIHLNNDFDKEPKIKWEVNIMVFDTVKTLISEQLGIETDGITEASYIQEDLGADSLDIVDLIMVIEDEFDIEIPEDQVENIKTVGDIVKFIEDTMVLRTPKHRSF